MGSCPHADDRRRQDHADQGFTLIEMLIVIGMMAVIAAALAMTISVVLRTSPDSQRRVDDARSVQGLVTWLPQDVDAVPPDGLNTDPAAAWPCSGTAPANSFNVVTMQWSERTDSTINFVSTYRYEFNGSTWHVLRYTCDDSTSSMSGGLSLSLTDALPAWNNIAPPAKVTMCAAKVDNAGNCPAGSEITTNTAPDVQSLKFRITRLDGVEVIIDAASKNPDQDLADDPNATTNAVPTISQTNFVVDMFAGDTVTVDLNTTHNPADADGDTLSVAIDSSEPAPPGITASTSDPLDVTLTADPGLTPGAIAPRLVLIVSDPRAGWVDLTLTINIVPEANLAPTLSPAVYDLQLSPGDTVILPLDVTHGAVDPNGDAMSATVSAWPPGRVREPTVADPSHPLDITIEAQSSTISGFALIPIIIEIADGRGGTVTAQINIEIVAPVANNVPTVTTSNVDISMIAGETVTLLLDASHGASDPDADPLSAELDTSSPYPSGVTTSTPGGLEVELTADPSVVDGPLTSPVALVIRDGRGGTVNATVTITITPTPPPPSDCVLGALTAAPSAVDRQGGGSSPKVLKNDVTVSLTSSGSCDGLVLKYDTGDTSGLGVGTGRVFPVGSPSNITIFGRSNSGTEKWVSGTFTLTATTTSDIAATSVTTTLTVN